MFVISSKQRTQKGTIIDLEFIMDKWWGVDPEFLVGKGVNYPVLCQSLPVTEVKRFVRGDVERPYLHINPSLHVSHLYDIVFVLPFFFFFKNDHKIDKLVFYLTGLGCRSITLRRMLASDAHVQLLKHIKLNSDKEE